MNRAQAYKLLSQELETLRCLPEAELLARIGSSPESRPFQEGQEGVVIEITVHWANQRKDAIRIHGVAYGPSNWHTERIEEGITVSLASGLHSLSYERTQRDA